MPEITYIVRLYCHDGFVEEYEQARREDADALFNTFSAMIPEDYEVVELLSYDYATHTETLIKQS